MKDSKASKASKAAKGARGARRSPVGGVQKNATIANRQPHFKKIAADRAKRKEAGKSEEEKRKDKEALEEAKKIEENRRKRDEEKKRLVEEARKKKREEAQERMAREHKEIEEKEKERQAMRDTKKEIQEKKGEENTACKECMTEKESQGQKSKCKECLRQAREAVNSNSLLLRLPAELRNAIYDYAIDGKVYFVTARDGTVHKSVSAKRPEPYNRLQDVCRQLQVETADIDVRTKKIYVIEGPTLEIMRRTKDVRLNNIQNTVILHGEMTLDTNPYEPMLHDMIIALAWKNPQARIIVRVERLHFDVDDGRNLAGFFSLAGTILAAIRGIQRFHPPATHIHDWQRRKSVGQLNAPNLHFFPRDRFCDREELRRLALGDTVNNSVLLSEYYNNDVRALVAEVASWYKIGL